MNSIKSKIMKIIILFIYVSCWSYIKCLINGEHRVEWKMINKKGKG